jgi:hypothetical protein
MRFRTYRASKPHIAAPKQGDLLCNRKGRFGHFATIICSVTGKKRPASRSDGMLHGYGCCKYSAHVTEEVASSRLFFCSRPVRLGVRTPGFHPGSRGSIPLRATHRNRFIRGGFFVRGNSEIRAKSLLEHFRALPAEEGDFGGDEVDGVLLDVGAVEAGDFWDRVAVEVAADEDGQVILEGEGAEIKKLVVQGAQREAIFHDIGAVVRVPTDVRGLQPDDLVVQLEVVPANGAAVAVVADDDGGEADVAFALPGDRGGLQLDAARQEDVLVLARREVVVKHFVGDGDQIVRPRPQPLPQLLRQRPRRVRVRQLSGKAISILQLRWRAHDPNAIVHQPGPRIFRPLPLHRPPEQLQQPLHRGLRFDPTDRLPALLPLPQRIQDQQRLVRRPHVPSLPLFELKFGHGWGESCASEMRMNQM